MHTKQDDSASYFAKNDYWHSSLNHFTAYLFLWEDTSSRSQGELWHRHLQHKSESSRAVKSDVFHVFVLPTFVQSLFIFKNPSLSILKSIFKSMCHPTSLVFKTRTLAPAAPMAAPGAPHAAGRGPELLWPDGHGPDALLCAWAKRWCWSCGQFLSPNFFVGIKVRRNLTLT